MGDSPDNPDGLPWETASEEDEAPSAAELEDAGQESMFGGPPPATSAGETLEEPAEQAVAASRPADASESAAPDPTQPYRVLACKYRPQTFAAGGELRGELRDSY